MKLNPHKSDGRPRVGKLLLQLVEDLDRGRFQPTLGRFAWIAEFSDALSVEVPTGLLGGLPLRKALPLDQGNLALHT